MVTNQQQTTNSQSRLQQTNVGGTSQTVIGQTSAPPSQAYRRQFLGQGQPNYHQTNQGQPTQRQANPDHPQNVSSKNVSRGRSQVFKRNRRIFSVCAPPPQLIAFILFAPPRLLHNDIPCNDTCSANGGSKTYWGGNDPRKLFVQKNEV